MAHLYRFVFLFLLITTHSVASSTSVSVFIDERATPGEQVKTIFRLGLSLGHQSATESFVKGITVTPKSRAELTAESKKTGPGEPLALSIDDEVISGVARFTTDIMRHIPTDDDRRTIRGANLHTIFVAKDLMTADARIFSIFFQCSFRHGGKMQPDCFQTITVDERKLLFVFTAPLEVKAPFFPKRIRRLAVRDVLTRTEEEVRTDDENTRTAAVILSGAEAPMRIVTKKFIRRLR